MTDDPVERGASTRRVRETFGCDPWWEGQQPSRRDAARVRALAPEDLPLAAVRRLANTRRGR